MAEEHTGREEPFVFAMKKKNVDADDIKKLKAILEENRRLDFVDRIFYPESYPVLRDEDGNYMTHKMSWGEFEGTPIVFPEVIHDVKTGMLHNLGKEGMKHAIDSGEYIPFTNTEEADWFTKNYKKVWQPPEWQDQIKNDRYEGYLGNQEGVNTQIRNFVPRDPSVGDASDMDSEAIINFRERLRKQGRVL